MFGQQQFGGTLMVVAQALLDQGDTAQRDAMFVAVGEGQATGAGGIEAIIEQCRHREDP